MIFVFKELVNGTVYNLFSIGSQLKCGLVVNFSDLIASLLNLLPEKP